jgi:hypothetical protein
MAPQERFVIEEVPTDAGSASREDIESFTRDLKDLRANWDTLVEAHPNQWASMHDGRLFIAPTLEGLFEMLNQNGIDHARVPREFLGKGLPALLL